MQRKADVVLCGQVIEFFKGKPQIAAVYLFGSYGTEFQHPHSDIDIGVIFSAPPTFREELAMDAELTLGVKTDREIDFVNLNKAPVPLQFRALREGLLLYEGNYVEHSDFIEQVLKAHFEFQLRYPQLHYIDPEEGIPLGG